MSHSNAPRSGILLAILAAALYAINSPFSKLLLAYMPATLMAGCLYLGAGLGMGGIFLTRRFQSTQTQEARLTRLAAPPPLGGQKTPSSRQRPGAWKVRSPKAGWRARPCPPEQDLAFPTASASHQDACTRLLFSSIREQTEEPRTTVPWPPE